MLENDTEYFKNAITPEIPVGLEVLFCIARRGSATQAARDLMTTPARVLRRLSALEESLGAALFDRTPNGLIPTPALELILPLAEQAAGAIGQMRSELAGLERAPVGNVQLALLPGLADYLISRGLSTFLSKHPGISISFDPANAIVDLTQREADLAIRTVRPTTGDLVVQRLATFPLRVMAAPSLANSKLITRPADLPWLTFSEDLSGTPESTWLRQHVPEARVILRAPDLQLLLNAARSGIGALVVAEPLGQNIGLVSIPLNEEMPEGTLWLVARRAMRSVPRVEVLWNWLTATFRPN